MSTETINSYYNEVASNYDESRFSNTYGQFIDRQERLYLQQHLKAGAVLNLGCGTGRFMEYSTIGLDFSPEMLEISKQKHPEKNHILSSAETTPFEDNQFDCIICFHVIMHLSPEATEAIFNEVNRILKPGGRFIFDYPSAERRKLTRYKAESWHGANSLNKNTAKSFIQKQNWIDQNRKGVLFLPIHLVPKKLRNLTFGFDQLLTRSIFKSYSSYLIQTIEKKS